MVIDDLQVSSLITAENICNRRSAYIERHSQVLDRPLDPILAALAAVV